MQTLFVTGADGFVGLHLIQYLRQRGYEIVAGVRNRARKLALERRFGKALVCEVSDAINVARAIASVRPDGVIHLAGPSRTGDAYGEPLVAYQSIVTAWANVLDGVRRVVPRAKVVMASASDVYGNTGSSGQPLSEDTRPEPLSTFGSLKASAESIAHTFYKNFHLDVSIARPFQYLGPGQSESSYFGAVARKLATWDDSAGDSLAWHDLCFTRDVLHVQDVVEAYERILQVGKPDEVYNVCSGQPRTCREIVQNMISSTGRQLTLTETPLDDDGTQIPVLVGDNSKITSELGWTPSHTIEQATRELVRSFETPAPVNSWQ